MKASGASSNRKGRGKRRPGRGGASTNSITSTNTANQKKEEDVLIEFMSFLRSGNDAAVAIHKEFGGDTDLFVEKAREFLLLPQSQRQHHVGKLKDDYNEKEEQEKDNGEKNRHLLEEKEEDNTSLSHLLADRIQEALTLAPENHRPNHEPYISPSNTNMHHLDLNPADTTVIASTSTIETATKMTTSKEPDKNTPVPNAVTVKWQPKRLNTRLTDQPGKIDASYAINNSHRSAGNLSSYSESNTLILPPKTEITACWQLPLDYIRKRALEISSIRIQLGDNSVKDVEQWTIQDALTSLTVGLFRRGCPENGSSHAIIAKQIVPPSVTTTTASSTSNSSGSAVDATRNSLFHAKQALEYFQTHGDLPKASHNNHDNNLSKESYTYNVNHQLGIIHGTVPFFTPRTPGNVVLRLYFEHDPMYTLATSPCITVRVTPNTLEQTLRFILSNFKNKKGSGVNFSSIYSLTSVLEQYKYCHTSKHDHDRHPNNTFNQLDSAGRAVWGGICEARKILDAAKIDYWNKCQKLQLMEQELHELEQKNDETCEESKQSSHVDNTEDQTEDDCNISDSLQRKRKEYHAENNSNERKWREVQLSFASLLKSIVTEKKMKFLLKVDIIKKLDLEYQLWCPICESFAPNPFEKLVEDETIGRVVQLNYPYPIKPEHFDACRKNKKKMQHELCGFSIADFSHSSKRANHNLFNSFSSAMVHRFQQDCQSPDSNILLEKKKHAQAMTQKAVDLCDAFDAGTRVVVFGSSANGFGSPHSDLDMCLEMLSGVEVSDEETTKAMSSLAEKLTEVGMKNVDTSRLTARIPVIKFHVPVGGILIECDISKANPLACLNTRLLRSYASISPSVRILASIIKRWAKCRNINDPSQHTLSSYGYILMLLHFLTTHKQFGTTFKSICSGVEDNNGTADSQNTFDEENVVGYPLLPNLQWVTIPALSNAMDTAASVNTTQNMSLLRLQEKPRVMMPHPTQDDYMVNTYFVDATKDARVLRNLQEYTNHTMPIASLGYVLFSFFRYYAFDFDYKNHVVSLNAAMRNNSSHVDRESKAEWDGWRMVGSSLSIEDPFEEFYDVAHVLKASNFQNLKREFALAYSKIRDAMDQNIEDGETLLDFLCQNI
jgi:DNA polymerase sigma